MKSKQPSNPVGSSVSDVRREKIASSAEYAALVENVGFSESVARMIIGYRMKHDLTQKQLAAIVKMPIPVISRLENGEHTPNGRTVDRLCEALGMTVEFRPATKNKALQLA